MTQFLISQAFMDSSSMDSNHHALISKPLKVLALGDNQWIHDTDFLVPGLKSWNLGDFYGLDPVFWLIALFHPMARA